MKDVIAPAQALWQLLHRPVQWAWVFWATIAVFATIIGVINFPRYRKALDEWAARNGQKRPSHVEALAYAMGVKFTSFLIISFLCLLAASLWDGFVIRDLQAKKPDRATVTRSRGHDKAGRSADYDVVLVSGEYFWKFGSTISVVNSEGNEVPIEQKLTGNGIATLINRSSDVIAVGMSSCVGRIEEEEGRAYDRARNIVSWVRQIPLTGNVEHLYMLNLGQYNVVCGSGPREREQRLLLVVGVTNKEPGVNIQESFRDALMHTDNGILRRLDLSTYTNWPEQRFSLEVAM
jgi:hypothetical protein